MFRIYILQEKYQLRLKVLEEGLRMSSSGSSRSTIDRKSVSYGPSRRKSLGGPDNLSKLPSNGFVSRRSPSLQLRSSVSSSISRALKQASGTSKSFDGGSRTLGGDKVVNGTSHSLNNSEAGKGDIHECNTSEVNRDEKSVEFCVSDSNDSVPGLFYDMLQKEIINLRKACHEKDQSLKDKDDAIEVMLLLLLCFIVKA